MLRAKTSPKIEFSAFFAVYNFLFFGKRGNFFLFLAICEANLFDNVAEFLDSLSIFQIETVITQVINLDF